MQVLRGEPQRTTMTIFNLLSPSLIYSHIMKYYGLDRIVVPSTDLDAVNRSIEIFDLPYHAAFKLDNFVIIKIKSAYNGEHEVLQDMHSSSQRKP